MERVRIWIKSEKLRGARFTKGQCSKVPNLGGTVRKAFYAPTGGYGCRSQNKGS